MALTKRLSGFRYVEIRQGDTLQALAARELGNAELWTDLIAINGLDYPYLTGDPDVALASENGAIKLYGESLIVPATTTPTSSTDDPTRAYGVDILLAQGRLVASPTGDLMLVSGLDNLSQALGNAVDTPLGQLIHHQNYGCGVHKLKGKGGTVGAVTLAAKYVEATMLSDTRVNAVKRAAATFSADAIDATAVVQPITGASVDFARTVTP